MNSVLSATPATGRLLTRLGGLGLAVFLLGACSWAADEPRVLTSVPEIRSLSGEEAAKGLPVRLRGTVVDPDYGDGWFKVHDGTESLSIDLSTARQHHIWLGGRLPKGENALGALVEIEGITGPGGYSPVVIPIRLRRVGTGQVPPARCISMEQLISGSEVSQQVELEGVVWGVVRSSEGKLGLKLMVEGHLCELGFRRQKGLEPEQFVDARVRVRGFCRPIANFRSEAVRVYLTVGSQKDIEVLRPPPANPFQAPQVPLKGLLSFSRVPDRFHRKVTQGVVNFVSPNGFFFLQEGTAGVRVESTSAAVQVGDLVEVAGFVDTTHKLAALTEAVARRLGPGSLLEPQSVSVKHLLNPEIVRWAAPDSAGDHAGGLVRLRAVISEIEWHKSERLMTLFLVSEGHRFQAFLPALDPAASIPWAPGAEIEVTGVCDLMFQPGETGSLWIAVKDFSLWLRTLQDVRVLRPAPWWTPLRLGLTLGGTCIVLALTLGWVWLLRRQVARQMEVIGEKLRSEAVSAERNRVARDLHDTLEQQLAGVALQLDGAEELIRKDPQTAAQEVGLARRMLRHTRNEARRSVWDLRSQVLELQGLPAALQTLAENAAGHSGPTVKVQVTGELSELPAGAEFQFLRVAQEALANALKHAQAQRVLIALECAADAVRLRISDDGKGFAPGALTRLDDPHFGVLGMQERAARIGAELSIVGTPGAGCVVTLTLPCRPAAQCAAASP